MKIGEWDNLGRARALLQRQLGELGADEVASHVTVNPESGRMRILVATDRGLFDYQYGPAGSDPGGDWILRGQLLRWSSVRGLRLQTDAQIGATVQDVKSVWRLVAEDPKIELGVSSDAGERAVEALATFAGACMQRSG